jgi:hypothetical protein
MTPECNITLHCKDIGRNEKLQGSFHDRGFRLFHEPGDPGGVSRLLIRCGELEAVLFPSKGLSLGQVLYKGKPVFWEAPNALPDPEALNLWLDDVCIGGKPMQGFSYLPTFCAGIELYGLKNWGMPRRDRRNGELMPLHGETSNIPVAEAMLDIDHTGVTVAASFIYRDMKGSKGSLWYTQGEPWFRVYKFFRIENGSHERVIIRDTFENISDLSLTPDWGYHVTFRPEAGSRLLLGSKHREERSGGTLPDDLESWTPQTKMARREETGIIHKELMDFSPEEKRSSFVLLKHTNGEGLIYKFPKSPYFQTWSCRGGAGSDEFTLKNGETLLKRNWDGLGIEIGSSSSIIMGILTGLWRLNRVFCLGSKQPLRWC